MLTWWVGSLQEDPVDLRGPPNSFSAHRALLLDLQRVQDALVAEDVPAAKREKEVESGGEGIQMRHVSSVVVF